MNLKIDDLRWQQASLPVKMEGLGIRKVEDLAIPGYFSSLHSALELSSSILPGVKTLDVKMNKQAGGLWEAASKTTELPSDPAKQNSCDRPIAERTYQTVIEGSNSVTDLATSGGYSGACLEAIPSPQWTPSWTMNQCALRSACVWVRGSVSVAYI